MKTSLKHVLLTVLISIASTAHAANVICEGTVDILAYHQPGNLMLKLSGMNVPVFICSTDVDWVVPGSLSGNTSPNACKALYATFLTAKVTGAVIHNMYFDGDQVPASCNSFANWTQVNVRYYTY